MDMMNKNVLGIGLICVGILLIFPMMPKIFIFFLGFYLLFLGVRILKSNYCTRSCDSRSCRRDYFDVDSEDSSKK